MIRRIKNWLIRIFKKKLKSNNKPKQIELVAGGFIKAPDQYVVNYKEFEEKCDKKRKSKKQ